MEISDIIVGLHVSMVLKYSKKKSSVTSTLVVNKSIFRFFFKRMVVGYRKIEERLVYILHLTANIKSQFLIYYVLEKNHVFF